MKFPPEATSVLAALSRFQMTTDSEIKMGGIAGLMHVNGMPGIALKVREVPLQIASRINPEVSERVYRSADIPCSSGQSYSYSVQRYSYSKGSLMTEPIFDHERLDVYRLSID